MGDDEPGPPLKRRVPGAARSGPAPSARRALPDTLIARMQAAVDAAHAAQGAAPATEAEPATEPLPRMQAAVAAQDWPASLSSNGAGRRGDAWNRRLAGSAAASQPEEIDAADDLSESYLAFDPDLTAGCADDSWADDIGLDGAGSDGTAPANRVAGAQPPTGGYASGWEAFRRDVEPGTGAKHERAAWWDHATQSGRTGRAIRPSRARQRLHPGTAMAPPTAPAPAAVPEQSPPPPRPPKPDRTDKPERAIRPQRAEPQRTDGLPRPGGQDQDTRASQAASGVLDPPLPPSAPSLAPSARPLAPSAQPKPPSAQPKPAAPRRSRRSIRRPPRPLLAGVVALVVVLIAAGVVALALTSRNNHNAASSDGSRARNIAARDIASAAAWVAAQVSHAAVVACDPAMCRALARHGFPAAQLRQLGHSASYPLTSALVVATPVVRRQFGTSLAANWAPAVLAGFGSGADRITVRVMAPHGALAYESALRADARQRKAVGVGLMTSRQISTTPAARSAMAAGDVDARLLIVFTGLASQYPIDILAFGRTWSGTTAGVPLRTAYVAEHDPAANMNQTAYAHGIIGVLRAQPAAYRPVHVAVVRLAGRMAIRFEFPAPSPLGLVSPSQ
jgi:hypothetical protein